LPNGTPNPDGGNKPLKWYRIIPQVVPLQYDSIRECYAYRIKYFVTDYKITEVKVDEFTRNPWPGPHKYYEYSFTGKNTEIKSFEQDFNYLYYTVLSDKSKTRAQKLVAQRERQQKQFAAQGPDSKQGANGKEADFTSAAAGSLYSLADIGINKLAILGDPDLIINESNSQEAVTSKEDFLINGSVNSHAGEVYYAIKFNKNNDWSYNTGIVDFDYNPASIPEYSSSYSAAYRINYVFSRFNQGTFSQELEGIYMITVDPNNALVPGDYTLADDVTTTNQPSTSVASENTQREEGGSSISSTLDLRLPNQLPGQNYNNTPADIPPLLGGSTPVKVVSQVELGQYPDYVTQASQQRLMEAFDNSGSYIDKLKPLSTNQDGALNS
jgi:hypothetical protein